MTTEERRRWTLATAKRGDSKGANNSDSNKQQRQQQQILFGDDNQRQKQLQQQKQMRGFFAALRMTSMRADKHESRSESNCGTDLGREPGEGVGEEALLKDWVKVGDAVVEDFCGA
jgi:hypothetical protein